MKIAILTFTHNKNFGAALQCYALSQYLINKGHEIILLRDPRNSIAQKVSCKMGTFERLKRIIIYYIKKTIRYHYHDSWMIRPYTYSQIKKKNENINKNIDNFQDFYNHYLPPFTPHYQTSQEIKEHLPNVDLYIVGSDQVWNPKNVKDKYPLFYFSFLDKEPRISYAASFGGEINDLSKEQIIEIKDYLTRFNAISVRENKGLDILNNYFGINQAVEVIDPTFLIPKSYYTEISSHGNTNGKGFLFSFKFKKSEDWRDTICYMGNELQLKVRADFSVNEIKGVYNNPVLTVPDWLQLIQTSDFIFTDSFHCMVFCIIFGKQFVVMPTGTGNESRLSSLLSKIGLESRLYLDYESIKKDFSWKEKIDYSSVWIKLLPIINKSKNFLESFLT